MANDAGTRRSRRAAMEAAPWPAEPPTVWKAWESLWVVLCAGSFGFAGPWILLWVSTRARRFPWVLIALLFCAAYVTAFWMMDTGGLVSRDGFYWFIFLCWIGTTAFAVHVNPEYLSIKWQRRSARRAGARHSSHRSSARLSGAASGTRPAAGGSEATAPAESAAAARTAPAGNSATAGAAVDINSAAVAELAALPGLTADLAQQAVELRRERGPFRSVEQFAADLSLQPHVYARLRGRLACRTKPQAPPAFGRRVDY